MSKFLLNFIQKTSGYLNTIHTASAMFKRGNLRTPRFKPEVKAINNREKQSAAMSPRKEKVEVLSPPIKSDADKKIYK